MPIRSLLFGHGQGKAMTYQIPGIVLLVTLLPVTGAKDKYVLDLTTEKVPEETIGWGGGVGSSGPQPELPLGVELVGVDRGVYRHGVDLMTYEIRLTNNGSVSLKIPWRADQRKVYGGGALLRSSRLLKLTLRASVGLIVSCEGGGGLVFGSRFLYGLASDPTTYRVLGPKESVLIRASDLVAFDLLSPNAPNSCKESLPRTFRVEGFFELHDSSESRYYKQLLSENAVRIAVEEAPP